jgi:aryl-alcohol dehydrogenase-like predicted oxidoreductase
MEFTQISHIEKKVMRIGLGTWAMGGWMWGGSDEEKAIETILQALNQGINLIDTAPVYGFGTSETIVGKALKKFGEREKVVVATKLGLHWKDGKISRDLRKESILKEIDDSLKRLQVDYIDLYQVHWPDPSAPIKETAEVLQTLQEKGKIQAIGVSNFSTEQMKEFQKIAPLDVLQSPFNLFERKIEESELPYCKENDIAILGYGPLCRGLLTGRMRVDTQFSGDDLRKVDPKFQQPRYSQYLRCVDRLQDWMNQKYQKPLIALAVRWVLDSGSNVALWGSRKPEQLKDIEAVWNWKLKPDDFLEINHILAESIKDPVGPEFMAPP